ncbi:MAG: hypothetical protein ACKPKO_36625, partial [Candidatus Fonsibacter sp.]
PIGGPWSFFTRIRILAGGQTLEDIDMYDRVHEMFSIFGTTESRINDFSEIIRINTVFPIFIKTFTDVIDATFRCSKYIEHLMDAIIHIYIF